MWLDDLAFHFYMFPWQNRFTCAGLLLEWSGRMMLTRALDACADFAIHLCQSMSPYKHSIWRDIIFWVENRINSYHGN